MAPPGTGLNPSNVRKPGELRGCFLPERAERQTGLAHACVADFVAVFLGEAQRIRSAGRRSRPCHPCLEPIQDSHLSRRPCDEMNRVHPPGLADAIHAADALFEARRIPRQFEIDHEPATPLQIEAFSCRIGGKEESWFASLERLNRGMTLVAVHAAVQHHRRTGKRLLNPKQRVPILRKHNRGFVPLSSSRDEPRERRQLAFTEHGQTRGLFNPLQRRALARAVGQERHHHPRGFVCVVCLAGSIVERER